MNWIFPIAGFGTRTKDLGEYKPFIEICSNFSILKACLLGLRSMFRDGDTFIFISTKQHEEDFNVTSNILSIMSEIKLGQSFCDFVERCDTTVPLLDETPPGQALTIFQGISSRCQVSPDDFKLEPATVINADQFIMFDIDSVEKQVPSVGIYFDDGDKSCFFDIDLFSNTVNEIKEKQKISSYASAGVFYFPTINSIMECIEWGIENNVTTNGELYLSSCLDYFPKVSYFKTDMKFNLGNPKNINRFKRFWKFLDIKSERFFL